MNISINLSIELFKQQTPLSSLKLSPPPPPPPSCHYYYCEL